MSDPLIRACDHYVVLEPAGAERLLTAAETLDWLIAQLEALDEVPADLASLPDTPEPGPAPAGNGLRTGMGAGGERAVVCGAVGPAWLLGVNLWRGLAAVPGKRLGAIPSSRQGRPDPCLGMGS